MRSGGLYFPFFHYTLLLCLLIGSVLFGNAVGQIYLPDLMLPSTAWYLFVTSPGTFLFPMIAFGIFAVLAILYRFVGVLGMTLAIAACGLAFIATQFFA